MCFLPGGTHVTSHMSFIGGGGGKHTTSDLCFLGGGTHITRDMRFPVGGTDITSDKRSPGKKITITKPVLHLFLDLGKENVFYHILERKNNFLGCKNKKFKM